MSVSAPVPHDHPMIRAWIEHKAGDAFANSKKWAASPGHLDGSLWALFAAGWTAATERAASLHEVIDPASGAERASGSPGADAMGAVIQYRDEIRKQAKT